MCAYTSLASTLQTCSAWLDLPGVRDWHQYSCGGHWGMQAITPLQGTCTQWRSGHNEQVLLPALQSPEFNSSFSFPLHFLPCFSAFCCSLLPVFSALLVYSPEYFPSPFSVSTISQSWKVNNCMVAEYQYGHLQFSSWGTRKKTTCFFFLFCLNGLKLSRSFNSVSKWVSTCTTVFRGGGHWLCICSCLCIKYWHEWQDPQMRIQLHISVYTQRGFSTKHWHRRLKHFKFSSISWNLLGNLQQSLWTSDQKSSALSIQPLQPSH